MHLSSHMSAIYDAISDLMDSCIKELRKSNKIDTSELTLEQGLFKSFDDIVRRQLDSVWHTVSHKTKQVWAVTALLYVCGLPGCMPPSCCPCCCLLMTHALVLLLLHTLL